MIILNLTQHDATPDQKLAGVVDLAPEDQTKLRKYLTVAIAGYGGLASISKINADMLLQEKADCIVSEFVIPRIMENAWAYLHQGGYETTPLDALDILNPRVAANGLACMIGGFAPLMDRLIPRLKATGITVLYALSERRSTDEHLPDGTVLKAGSFKHEGFFQA